ncbi:MAG: hypothetical protein KDI16_06425 [Halioglobus sp.]|nr:hypothetical protein [Halioglobus sp.]
MTGRLRPHHVLVCLLLGGHIGGVLAKTRVPDLPRWQVLEFEQRAFWATAASRVELTPAGPEQSRWLLHADSSVADNSEQITLLLAARNGAVLQRERLSHGNEEQRYKLYDYRTDSILRERREPRGQAAAPPREWPLSSRREIDYPEAAHATAITADYALLPLADRFNAGDAQSAEILVHTDLNFYRVRMSRGHGITVDADFQIIGGEHVAGQRATQSVTLQVTPVGTQQDEPDFSLLGLYGRITILFDEATGLPLQLRGTAPRLGAAHINLRAVQMRDDLTWGGRLQDGSIDQRATPQPATPQPATPQPATPDPAR